MTITDTQVEAAIDAIAKIIHPSRGRKQRKDDMIRPPHLTSEQWLASLLSEKADVLRQVRREIHTRGNQHQKYLDRVDRAIARAREGY